MRIETERLFLREMTMDDFDALYKVLADKEIMQHYPYTFDKERVRAWIQRNMDRYDIAICVDVINRKHMLDIP